MALLQRSSWHFDLRSALIGAILAWLLAFLAYRQREAIGRLARQLWAPVINWRRQLQASGEEKYFTALRDQLRQLLLFAPKDPPATFIPPTFRAPAPLPHTASSSGDLPPPLNVTFAHLLEGHSRLLITGTQTAGRTMTLALSVWSVAETSPHGKGAHPYRRFPLWGDLSQWSAVPAEVTAPLERLACLAQQSLPELMPKWLLTQLHNQPALILLDNWEAVPVAERETVAQWIEEAGRQLPNSTWLIATGPGGYGVLVEQGFVPLEIAPLQVSDEFITRFYTAWAGLPGQDEKEVPEEVRRALRRALETGASFPELTLRTALYLRTGQLPERLTSVLEALLAGQLYLSDLNAEPPELGSQVQTLAFTLLTHLARESRIEGHSFSQQEFNERILALLPPEAERSPKLEGLVKKVLSKSGLLRRQGKQIRLAHYVWEEYLTARALTSDPAAIPLLLEHLHDPAWRLLIECFVGLGEATPLVRELIQTATRPGSEKLLLQAARWAALALPEVAWRKPVMVALARGFMDPSKDNALRLELGRALALVGGDGARLFFIQALQTKIPALRGPALRGLGWTGTPQETAIMAGALRDPSPEIRQSAVLALGDLGTPGALRLLRQALSQGDEMLMLTIAEVMAKTPDGWEFLKEAAEQGDLLMRRAGAHGLGLIRRPWATELLQRLALEDTQWLVRSAADAALAASKEGQESTVTVPPPPVVDKTEWLMAWAARQGSGLGLGEAAMGTLLRALAEGDAETQVLAAQTLAYVGRQQHLEPLKALLTDDQPAVQRAAAEAIRRIEQRYAS